jgi:hypothetical protein
MFHGSAAHYDAIYDAIGKDYASVSDDVFARICAARGAAPGTLLDADGGALSSSTIRRTPRAPRARRRSALHAGLHRAAPGRTLRTMQWGRARPPAGC